MATPISAFRILAPEFSSVDDETVELWLELTEPLVSRRRFGKVYDQALALLTAHRMKSANVGAPRGAVSDIDNVDGVGTAFKVASYTSGGESVSFNNSALTAKLSDDAEYSQTAYGVQYITLCGRYMIPIISSGERC